MTKRAINHRLPVLGSAYDMPATRGECIDGTPLTGSREQRMTGRASCGAYQCRHNLLVTMSEDVRGRRHDGLAPEWTMNGDNTRADAPSCSLDVADTGPKSSEEVARILGIDKRRVQQIVKKWRATQGAVRMSRLGTDDEEE